MKIAYFDCIGGASGDMMLGAIVDAGLPLEALQAQLEALELPSFELRSRRVEKQGFGATQVTVMVDDNVPSRRLAQLEAVVNGSRLSPLIRRRALAILRRLGEVEAAIHGKSVEEVHLHELGGIDTVVDVVGVLLGLEALEVKRVVASPVPLGRGFIRGAHGQIPLPAPATVALLQGVPIAGTDLNGELVTPTGALLLASLADDFGPLPPMTLRAVGYGAGMRDLPVPNLLRLFIGEGANEEGTTTETLVELETNIDDLNPEIYEYVLQCLLDAGALDVMLIPVQMKKNRPATLLRAWCRPETVGTLTEILFRETSTLGVRQRQIRRQALPRFIHTVHTPNGAIRVKVARLDDGTARLAPEYEDCRRVAQSSGRPLQEIYRSAQFAGLALLQQLADSTTDDR